MRPSPPRSSTACSTTATSSAFGASRFACARRASWSHPPDRADPGRPIGRGTRFEGLRSPPSGSHLPPNPEIDPVRPKAAPTSPRSGRTPRPYGPLHPAAPPTSKPRSTRGELSGHQWGFLLALDTGRLLPCASDSQRRPDLTGALDGQQEQHSTVLLLDGSECGYRNGSRARRRFQSSRAGVWSDNPNALATGLSERSGRRLWRVSPGWIAAACAV